MSFLNVGIIGHVDSGKTSLARNLSSIAGTAAFDKHPQSQQRGITIDIGISKITNSPQEKPSMEARKENNEIVVIDCPGHAGLIKAVLLAANIIDILILVIDGIKGIQNQTIECLALQEAIGKRFLLVITKVDDPLNKFEVIERGFRKRFSEIQIFGISNKSGQGIFSLKQCLYDIEIQRQEEKDQEIFVATIDHSFTIKGTTGMILTGTVIKGFCRIGDNLSVLNQKYKLKSMQSFKIPLNEGKAGDRIGFNIIPGPTTTANIKETGERCLLYKEGSLIFTQRILIKGCHLSSYLSKKGSWTSIIDKMHFTIINETVISHKVYILQSSDHCYKFEEEFVTGSELLIIFNFPVAILRSGPTRIIGSRLDLENHGSRIILYGDAYNHPEPISAIKKVDSRKLIFDRWHNLEKHTLIGRGLDKFQISRFINMQVNIIPKEENKMEIKGNIIGPFGSSNKFLVQLNQFENQIENHLLTISHLEMSLVKIVKL